jgi:hypothetical protein
VQTSNVTLDLDGFYLFGSGPNSIGILASDQTNITVKNVGLVGFNTAVAFEASNMSVVMRDGRLTRQSWSLRPYDPKASQAVQKRRPAQRRRA